MKKIIFLLVVLFSVTTFSQVTTSKIQGSITDEAGPLFGATVVAKHVPSGTVMGAMTQDNGSYTIPNLRVGGPYTISISFVGYKTVEYTDIYLQLGKTTNIDVTMISESQELDEVVIRYTKDNTFNNDRTGAETSLGSKEIQSLPSISRSAADFYRLEPTASGGAFGGRNDQFNNFSLDGSIFNNPFGLDSATPGSQTDAQPVSLDAIEQIQVSTAPYDVTQSGFTGASVNAVTKSGTNAFHGTLFGFYRNQDLAGKVDLGGTTLTPDLNQTQYGFSLGGPIIKDKLFFFANYEYDNRDDLGSYYVANNGSQEVGGNVSRVLESDLQAVSAALANLGYDTGDYQGYIHDTKSTKGIYKIDWNAAKNTRVSFIYNFLRAYKDRNAHPSAIGRRGPDLITMQFRNSGYTINNNIDSYLAEINSNFSDGRTTNKFQIGYTHFDDYRDAFSAPAPVININRDGQRYIIAGHEPFSINNRLDQKVFQFTDNMTHYFGEHTATIGFAFEKFQFDNSFNLVGYGFDIFGGYDSVADFLVAANDGTVAGALAYAESQYAKNEWALVETNLGQMAFYLQDEWAVNDDLKLTAGLRIDKPLYFDTQQKIQNSIDNAYWYDESIPYFDEDGNEVTLSSKDLPSTDFMFSPRLGFNWDVKGDNTIQLRGGTGVFTGRLPFVWIGNQVANINVDFYTSTDKNFKFPQIWKSSLGLDYKFENGIVTSIDGSYSKDINGMMVRNYSIKNPTGTLVGVDNRPIYTAADRNGINQPWGQPIDSYIFTNTDVGYSYNGTFKATKSWENNLYISFAYNFTESMDASSIEAEITSDAYARNPAFGNVNKAVASHSLYGDRHRIIGVLSKKWTYGNDKWTTSLAGLYEYAQGGRFSYTYGGDINGDGSGLNDLIYIPTSSDINAMSFNSSESTEAEQRAALEAFILQDEYMSANRGEYAGKYDILSPWRGRWDVKFTQGYNLGGSKKIQFDLNMLNLTNLFNSEWGVVKLPTSTQPIGVSVDPITSTPTYSFDVNQKETFSNDYSLMSRWQIQGGLRFIF